MSDQELEAAAELAPEELSDQLSEEIAQRWDPERILKLVATRAGKGEALDATLRSRYETRLGVDLSHVRVYTGELAEEINKAYNANAVTIGNTGMILMSGSPEKSMATAEGQALLAHELTHVAQQQRGVYRDARFGDDTPFAADGSHEAEARREEAAVLQQEQGGNSVEAEIEAAQKSDDIKKMVIERVLDRLAESGWIALLRGGPFPRRP
jgi:hypothetical protein